MECIVVRAAAGSFLVVSEGAAKESVARGEGWRWYKREPCEEDYAVLSTQMAGRLFVGLKDGYVAIRAVPYRPEFVDSIIEDVRRERDLAISLGEWR